MSSNLLLFKKRETLFKIDESNNEDSENIIVSTDESEVHVEIKETEGANVHNTEIDGTNRMTKCPKKTIADVQQEYFQLFGHETKTIYDLYQTKEVLRSKMRWILGLEEAKSLVNTEIRTNIGKDNKELELLWTKMIDFSVAGNDKDAKEVSDKIKEVMGESYAKLKSQVDKKIKKILNDERKLLNPLVDKVWELKQYSGNKWLLMSTIYLCLVPKKFFDSPEAALLETDFRTFPVFRVRKCVNENENSAQCCAFFVDLNGRVYQHFSAFKIKNKYPSGTIAAPKDGIYNGVASAAGDSNASLEIFANHTSFTTYLDTGSSVIGLATMGITAASLVPAITVAPVVMLGTAVAGISCAAYSGMRSVYHLWDRNTHSQSNNILEAEARAAYLTIVGGLVYAGAAGVTQLLTNAAESGRAISTLTRNAVNVMNGTSIVVNGPVDGIYNIIVKWQSPNEEISTMEVLQISASLFLFTHSVCNFRTANRIIKSGQFNAIEGIRKDLTNSQRKGFNKLFEETVKVRGIEAGQQDIIRAYRNVPEFKQTLIDVFKIKKTLRQFEVEPTIASDGNIRLNNEMSVKAAELRNNLKIQPPEKVFENVPKNTAVADLEGLATKTQSTKPLMRSSTNTSKAPGGSDLTNIVLCAVELAKLSKNENLTGIIAELQKKHKTLHNYALEKFVEFVHDFYEKYSKDIDAFMHRHHNMVFYIAEIYNQIDQLCRLGGETIQNYIMRQAKQKFLEVESKVLDFFVAKIQALSEGLSTEMIDLFRKASNVVNIFMDTVSISNTNLKETVEFIITKFVDDRNIRLFFLIAVRLVDMYSEPIMNMLKRYISLDNFIMDIYNIVAKGGKCDEFIEKYRDRDFADLDVTVMDYYISQQPAGGKFVDCSLCNGKYYELDRK